MELTDERPATPARTLEARVAEELRAELARQGRTRRWLAARIGAPVVTVARWCRGDTSPGLDELDAMARALGLTLVRVLVDVERAGELERRPLRHVA